MADGLPEFRALFTRLQQAGAWEHSRLALVALRRPHNVHLALGLRLEGSAAGPKPMASGGEAEPFYAEVRDLGSDLTRFFNDIAEGHVSVGTGQTTRVALNYDDTPVDWHVAPDYVLHEGLRCALALANARLPPEAGPDLSSMDRVIAERSGHRYRSLERLAHNFLGGPYNPANPPHFEVSIPWPLQNLYARPDGARLRITLRARPSVPREQIILNLEIEGGDGDLRLTADDIRWAPGPVDAQGFVTLVGSTRELNGRPSAVNAFLVGIPEVELHEDIREASSFDDVPLVGTVPREWTPPNADQIGKVTGVRIEGFRLLRKVELDFTDVDLVIGRNQTGKSSLLDALALVSEGADGGLSNAISQRGGLQKILWRDGLTQAAHLTVVVKLEIATTQYRYAFRISPVGSADYRMTSEDLYQLDSAGNDSVQIMASLWADPSLVQGYDARELLLSQESQHPALVPVRSVLRRIAIYHFNPWVMRAPVPLRPGATLSRDGSNLAQIVHELKESSGSRRAWEAVLDSLHMVFPDVVIGAKSVSGTTIDLTWKGGGNEAVFFSSDLSDGTLTYLATLCALANRDASLVAIDEPESHLHPDALFHLFAASERHSDGKSVLLASHSDRLLAFFNRRPESVVVARRTEDRAELVRPPAELLTEWSREFSLADLRTEMESGDGK